MAMKAHLFSVFALLPAVLTATPSLKLELIGPKEAVKVAQKLMDQAAPLAEAAKRYETLLQEANPDRAVMQQLEETLRKGASLNQGITLVLRFTNTGDTPVELQYGPDTSQNLLSVDGPAAVNLPYRGMMTMEFRMPPTTTIAPGAAKEFTIRELSYGSRDMSRWLIAKPGTYSATVVFTTTINDQSVALTSNKVAFEVKAE